MPKPEQGPGQVPSVGRVVHVHKTGPKGWKGPRPGVITRAWGSEPGSACNVQVTMDPGDAGFPAHVGLTSVQVCEAGAVVPGAEAWAEWPARVGPSAAVPNSDVVTSLLGRVDELERKLGQRITDCDAGATGLVKGLAERLDRLEAALTAPANTAAADVPGEPAGGGKGRKKD